MTDLISESSPQLMNKLSEEGLFPSMQQTAEVL